MPGRLNAGERQERASRATPVSPSSVHPSNGPDPGIGIEVAATGNVVASTPTAGILLGWGRYQRDVIATGNVLRATEALQSPRLRAPVQR